MTKISENTNKKIDLYEDLTGYKITDADGPSTKTSYRMEHDTMAMILYIRKHTNLPFKWVVKPFVQDLYEKLIFHNKSEKQKEIILLEKKIQRLKREQVNV
tara:strand:- start:38 stop:340 length:303 start_codon:yes stop_codon:yes gene_type:complete